jgi:hypothetical protein
MALAGKGLSQAALLGAFLSVFSQESRAQEFPAPTNRNHTIDMHQGSAIGSSRIVGMGGTAVASAEGSSGILINPAAPGVRPSTSNDVWDWDFHFETRTPKFGSDFENNGIEDTASNIRPTLTAGLVFQYKEWGFGFSVLNSSTTNDQEMNGTSSLTTAADFVKLSLARHLLDGQVVVGGGIRGVGLLLSSIDVSGQQTKLLELTGQSVEVGAVLKPNKSDYRLGASFSAPVLSTETSIENCDPLNCAGYIVPGKVKLPWQVAVGIASRRAKTPWNIQSKERWRDEKALRWGVDLILTGKTKRGAGLQAFGQHELQPSGRKTTFSLRGGVEYEWVPGRLRVRGGSYFEGSRFKDPEGEDIPGRLHLTMGLEWRFWQFRFWGQHYRTQLSFWADGAEQYAASGISLGFWH